jgi:hypothetical protein
MAIVMPIRADLNSSSHTICDLYLGLTSWSNAIHISQDHANDFQGCRTQLLLPVSSCLACRALEMQCCRIYTGDSCQIASCNGYMGGN